MTRKLQRLKWPVLAAAITICGLSAPALADQDHKNKVKSNKGNHYGWQRGVGNPHQYSDNYTKRRYYRDNRDDDRWLDSHLNTAEHRRLHADAQRLHREWHRTHPNDHRDNSWERAHQRLHDRLNASHRQQHRRYYRQVDRNMSSDMRNLVTQLNQKHARWHRNNDDRDDPRYESDHRAFHRELDAYYDRMRREYR